MQFGIIFLRSSVHTSPFEHFQALELVEQSGLKSKTLFATFASKSKVTVKYGFDAPVASFQKTRGQALKMFDIALRNPVTLDLLLEELQTISEGAPNRKGMALNRIWRRF